MLFLAEFLKEIDCNLFNVLRENTWNIISAL